MKRHLEITQEDLYNDSTVSHKEQKTAPKVIFWQEMESKLKKDMMPLYTSGGREG